VVTWAAKARFRVLPCRVVARTGLRLVRAECAAGTSEDPMTQPKPSRRLATRSTARKTAKPLHAAIAPARPDHPRDPITNHARIIAMLADAYGCNDRSDHYV